jgi:hypothetical protein
MVCFFESRETLRNIGKETVSLPEHVPTAAKDFIQSLLRVVRCGQIHPHHHHRHSRRSRQDDRDVQAFLHLSLTVMMMKMKTTTRVVHIMKIDDHNDHDVIIIDRSQERE